MKRFVIIFLSVFAALSCEERNPALFGDITGVYFNNRAAGNVLVDSTSLTFVYIQEDFVKVPVKVQLLGRPAEYDRDVSISVSSENAVEGIDYILPETAVLPAGDVGFDYTVGLKRTDALKLNEKMLVLELHSNEYFELPLTEIVQAAGPVTTLKFRVFFSDMFTEAPEVWEDNLLGVFSQQKFELICDVLVINPGDFNDATKMTLAKQTYIAKEMTAYIKEEVAKKNREEEYDANIIDAETGNPISFERPQK